jgi:hypothetical protein
MDGQLSTRDGSSGRPGALLEIYFPTKNSSTPYLNIYIVFVTGEDEYSRYNYRRYTYIICLHDLFRFACVLCFQFFSSLLHIVLLPNVSIVPFSFPLFSTPFSTVFFLFRNGCPNFFSLVLCDKQFGSCMSQ